VPAVKDITVLAENLVGIPLTGDCRRQCSQTEVYVGKKTERRKK